MQNYLSLIDAASSLVQEQLWRVLWSGWRAGPAEGVHHRTLNQGRGSRLEKSVGWGSQTKSNHLCVFLQRKAYFSLPMQVNISRAALFYLLPQGIRKNCWSFVRLVGAFKRTSRSLFQAISCLLGKSYDAINPLDCTPAHNPPNEKSYYYYRSLHF